MVETIGPMVDEAGRRGPFVRLAHVAGGLAGGALAGASAAALGILLGADGPDGKARGALVALSAAALVYDALAHGRRLGLGRQTPMGWRHRFSPGTGSFLYGVDLGTGLSTRIYFASFLVALLAAAVSASAWVGAAIGGGFGAVRALVAIVVGRRAQGRPTLIDDLVERRSAIELVNAAALVQFGVAISLL